MKVRDIVVESKKIDEAPMGMLARAGRSVAAAAGHKASQGKLKTGERANQLKKEYKVYLGEIGEKASVENLLSFLKKEGLPTSAAQKALGNVQPTTTQKVGGALKTAAKGAAGAVAGAAKGAVQGAKAATQKQPATESLNEEKLSSAAIDQAIAAAVQQSVKGQSDSGSQAVSVAGKQQDTATDGTASAAGDQPSTDAAQQTDPAKQKVTMKEIREMVKGLKMADKKKLVQHLEQTLPKSEPDKSETDAAPAQQPAEQPAAGKAPVQKTAAPVQKQPAAQQTSFGK